MNILNTTYQQMIVKFPDQLGIYSANTVGKLVIVKGKRCADQIRIVISVAMCVKAGYFKT